MSQENKIPPQWAIQIEKKWVQIQVIKDVRKKFFCIYAQNPNDGLIGCGLVRLCCMSQQGARQQIGSKQANLFQLDHLLVYQHNVKKTKIPSGLAVWTKKQISKLKLEQNEQE